MVGQASSVCSGIHVLVKACMLYSRNLSGTLELELPSASEKCIRASLRWATRGNSSNYSLILHCTIIWPEALWISIHSSGASVVSDLKTILFTVSDVRLVPRADGEIE